jgi:hypothetical protein
MRLPPKPGQRVKIIIEGLSAIRDPNRSLASEVRVAFAAYFHGNPCPIYRCPGGIVPMRDGGVLLGWPGGRRRAQDGLRRCMLVDQVHGTRKSRQARRSLKALKAEAEYRARSERRLGELMNVVPKHQGERPRLKKPGYVLGMGSRGNEARVRAGFLASILLAKPAEIDLSSKSVHLGLN